MSTGTRTQAEPGDGPGSGSEGGPTPPEWLTLEPGEGIVWTGGRRLRSIIGDVSGTVVFTVVGVAVLFVVFDWGVLPAEFDRRIYFLAGGGLLVANLLYTVVWRYLKVSNVDYALTTENVYVRRGVFSETVNRVRVGKIQNTTLSKDFFGNVFDYGNVGLSTAGGSGTEMVLSELDDPGEFQQLLRRQMDAVRDRGGTDRPAGTPAPVPAADPETVEELVGEARRMRETAAAVAELLGAEGAGPEPATRSGAGTETGTGSDDADRRGS